MAKVKTLFECSECGYQAAKWSGRCHRCQAWNSFTEVRGVTGSSTAPPPRGEGKAMPITQLPPDGGEVRIRIGIKELDRVLGGGLVSGSLSLLGGDPGVGKSTLLLMALGKLASKGLRVLYVTGEESARQVRLRSERLGVSEDLLYLLSATGMDAVQRAIAEVKPRFLCIDSVQVMRAIGVDSIPGSVSQVRAVADQTMEMAKGKDIATFLIGHVTREGTLAGPKMLEHLVDTVLYFECDGRSPLRILRAVKNRFGASGELGVFEMNEEGLVEVPDASARLLAQRLKDAPGTAVVAGMEGSRPLLTEVQALVGSARQGPPARVTLGVERARVAMLLAVLEKHDIPLVDRDVYVSAAGGVRTEGPAADLGSVAAMVSSAWERPIPEDMVFFGEVGLVGELRSVSFAGLRLREAWRHGFRRAITSEVPPRDVPEGMEVFQIRRVSELLGLLRRS